MSVSRRKPEDEVWFVHAPLKNEKRPIVHAVPPSNIPYLNGVMDTEEDIARRPTLWFRETDSDFVKLSKLGGRTDLLVHKLKERPKEPVGYPRAGWWVDMLSDGSEEKNEQSKDPYIFQVPAWFAHKHNKTAENDDADVNINYPYNETRKEPVKNFDEKIEEPRKYGQLRNYLHPVKVKSNSFIYDRTRPMPSESQMPKIISSFYENQRPKDYQDWKNKQNAK